MRRIKGVVFNLLEAVVSRDHGPETWDAMLDACGSDGVFTSLGSYDDAVLFDLVAAASDKLGLPEPAVVRWFGREALPLLAELYPELFAAHTDARSFVLTLNDIIHPEVRKLYPGADVPEFTFDASVADRLVLGYASRRRLCTFAEGLIEGAAVHYGQQVTIDQPVCMHEGAVACRLEIRFVG